MTSRLAPPSPGRAAGAAAVLLALAGAPAGAQEFALFMQGTLDARSALVSGGTATPLAGPTAFTLRAVFDTRSPNLVAPIPVPGFVSYAPSFIEFTLGGRAYAMQSFGAATPFGVGVAIFDATTPFGPPGRYGVGIIQNPLADGSGFVADYRGASPAFTLAAGGVTPTTFTGYAGVGVTSGVCIVGSPPACGGFAVTPIPMTWAGETFALSLGNYEEDLAPGGTAWTAQISAVPEPGSVVLVGAGGLALAGAGARRRRRLARAG